MTMRVLAVSWLLILGYWFQITEPFGIHFASRNTGSDNISNFGLPTFDFRPQTSYFELRASYFEPIKILRLTTPRLALGAGLRFTIYYLEAPTPWLS